MCAGTHIVIEEFSKNKGLGMHPLGHTPVFDRTQIEQKLRCVTANQI